MFYLKIGSPFSILVGKNSGHLFKKNFISFCILNWIEILLGSSKCRKWFHAGLSKLTNKLQHNFTRSQKDSFYIMVWGYKDFCNNFEVSFFMKWRKYFISLPPPPPPLPEFHISELITHIGSRGPQKRAQLMGIGMLLGFGIIRICESGHVGRLCAGLPSAACLCVWIDCV